MAIYYYVCMCVCVYATKCVPWKVHRNIIIDIIIIVYWGIWDLRMIAVRQYQYVSIAHSQSLITAMSFIYTYIYINCIYNVYNI